MKITTIRYFENNDNKIIYNKNPTFALFSFSPPSVVVVVSQSGSLLSPFLCVLVWLQLHPSNNTTKSHIEQVTSSWPCSISLKRLNPSPIRGYQFVNPLERGL